MYMERYEVELLGLQGQVTRVELSSTLIDSAGEPQAISCTSTRFCLMADLSGNVATFDGASWSAISNVDPGVTAGTGLTGASCADAAHCVAVDWEGNALVGTG